MPANSNTYACRTVYVADDNSEITYTVEVLAVYQNPTDQTDMYLVRFGNKERVSIPASSCTPRKLLVQVHIARDAEISQDPPPKFNEVWRYKASSAS
ncbi:hypothetical protein CVT24_010159 [Panaeolus cyanescens]|uniref:Uncharacterized protein n=1 Tax=Panaeolus cyanescens TaxID=181874 RepID=A0A409WLP7_9AGAR|nr:hypothetical protein CVT24_010159 [Panaeolus cyanescens]